MVIWVVMETLSKKHLIWTKWLPKELCSQIFTVAVPYAPHVRLLIVFYSALLKIFHIGLTSIIASNLVSACKNGNSYTNVYFQLERLCCQDVCRFAMDFTRPTDRQETVRSLLCINPKPIIMNFKLMDVFIKVVSCCMTVKSKNIIYVHGLRYILASVYTPPSPPPTFD